LLLLIDLVDDEIGKEVFGDGWDLVAVGEILGDTYFVLLGVGVVLLHFVGLYKRNLILL